MDEFVAHGATGPAASKHRLIPIQALLADCAISRLDRKQHRLPITTSFPDTHGRSIASPPPQKQEEVGPAGPASKTPGATLSGLSQAEYAHSPAFSRSMLYAVLEFLHLRSLAT